MKTITFNGREYPAFQADGNAARWAMPFANEILKDCKNIIDVGACKPEWAYPGARMVDTSINDGFHAHNLPWVKPDAIFSSHCLEHVPDWVGALNHWNDTLVDGGILFLYLPHPDQEYWLPWNNRKHVNVLSPSLMRRYFDGAMRTPSRRRWGMSFVTDGHDLNHSFYAVARK